MKTLYLLRHAKSSWDDPALADHDRPLAARGRKAAPLVARHLPGHATRPERMLCSTARRAVETAEAIAATLGGELPLDLEHGLYLCGSQALLDRIRRIPAAVGSLMLVAHNPDLHELAVLLAGSGDTADMAALQEKFPTAACAVLALEVPDWPALDRGAGRLIAFVRPRTLA